MKIGMVGAGGIARPHLHAWLALGMEVSVFSLDGRAPELVSEVGPARVVDSLADLVADAEIVDICTPTFAHREIAEAAAAAGRPVICEKPLALTVSDAMAMARACADAGVQLYPAHVLRFYPEYEAAREAVVNGRIGIPAVARYSRLGQRPGASWFTDQALSGGIAMDQMIHDIDFARWTFGDVRTVYAMHTDAGSPAGDGIRTISIHATLTHLNGALSSVVGIWSAAPTRFQTRFEIAGSDGLFAFDSLAQDTVAVNGDEGGVAGGYLPPASLGEDPMLVELRELSSAILGGPAARVTAEDGIRAIEIAVAVNESVQSGRPVEIGGAR